jgi:hypothetical protein
MKHLRLLLAALAVLALATPVRADFISWSYTTSPTLSLPADSPGTGSVAMIGASGSPMGGSEIVVANLKTISTASTSAPDNMITGGGYQVDVSLTDSLSHQSGTLTFLGKLTGMFSSGGAGLSNAFLSGTQSITLGGNVYAVTLDAFLPPGPPSSTRSGAIGAVVSVNGDIPGGNPGPSSISPEPSSLLLCGLGAVSCALAGWRRRRGLARGNL